MNDASSFSSVAASGASNRLNRFIAPRLLCASVLYLVATTALLPRLADASAAIDVFLAAVLSGLMVITVLRVARPAAFPQARRRSLVAVLVLAAAAASALSILLSAV